MPESGNSGIGGLVATLHPNLATQPKVLNCILKGAARDTLAGGLPKCSAKPGLL